MTLKFDSQDELEELQSRIYLDTKVKLTKKEILELCIKYAKKHYNELIKDMTFNQEELTPDEIDEILNLATDWGEGTEKLSQQVDEILYGKENHIKDEKR